MGQCWPPGSAGGHSPALSHQYRRLCRAVMDSMAILVPFQERGVALLRAKNTGTLRQHLVPNNESRDAVRCSVPFVADRPRKPLQRAVASCNDLVRLLEESHCKPWRSVYAGASSGGGDFDSGFACLHPPR